MAVIVQVFATKDEAADIGSGSCRQYGIYGIHVATEIRAGKAQRASVCIRYYGVGFAMLRLCFPGVIISVKLMIHYIRQIQIAAFDGDFGNKSFIKPLSIRKHIVNFDIIKGKIIRDFKGEAIFEYCARATRTTDRGNPFLNGNRCVRHIGGQPAVAEIGGCAGIAGNLCD